MLREAGLHEVDLEKADVVDLVEGTCGIDHNVPHVTHMVGSGCVVWRAPPILRLPPQPQVGANGDV